MFGRRPVFCPGCDALKVHVASLEAQLRVAHERIGALLAPLVTKPAESEPFTPAADDEEDEIPMSIRNAMSRRARQGTELYLEVEEQVRLFLAEGVESSEIERRVLSGDWDGVESAQMSADAMR